MLQKHQQKDGVNNAMMLFLLLMLFAIVIICVRQSRCRSHCYIRRVIVKDVVRDHCASVSWKCRASFRSDLCCYYGSVARASRRAVLTRRAVLSVSSFEGITHLESI